MSIPSEITEVEKIKPFCLQDAIDYARSRPKNNDYKVSLLHEVDEQSGFVRVDSPYSESCFSDALKEYAPSVGYTLFGVEGTMGGDHFAAGFARPKRVATAEDMGSLPGALIVYVSSKDAFGHDTMSMHAFCENSQLDAARIAWSQTPSVLTDNEHIIDEDHDYGDPF